jgi:hypothetical protein
MSLLDPRIEDYGDSVTFASLFKSVPLKREMIL